MNKMLFLISLFGLLSCNTSEKQTKIMEPIAEETINKEASLDTITFGGGCYWCMEAVFQRMKGVVKSESGFSGGTVKNPAYREVCNGTTGHAEVVQITYDKNQTSLEDILAVFFTVHDPTTLNRQGADEGTQYRSAIFYRNDKQKKIAENAIHKLTTEKVYDDKIVTEVKPFTVFYKAEEHHQDYYNQNKQQPYCQFVVRSKVEKFEKLFKDKMK